jgi:hypothetical protein
MSDTVEGGQATPTAHSLSLKRHSINSLPTTTSHHHPTRTLAQALHRFGAPNL